MQPLKLAALREGGNEGGVEAHCGTRIRTNGTNRAGARGWGAARRQALLLWLATEATEARQFIAGRASQRLVSSQISVALLSRDHARIVLIRFVPLVRFVSSS